MRSLFKIFFIAATFRTSSWPLSTLFLASFNSLNLALIKIEHGNNSFNLSYQSTILGRFVNVVKTKLTFKEN